MTPEHNKADPLARKILYHSRKLITQTAPFLLECIYALRDQPTDSGETISTDGKKLYYDPLQIIADFRRDKNNIAQQILHVTAHCLLDHPAQRSAFSENTAVFDDAADIKAAQFVSLACGEAFAHRLVRRGRYDHLPHLPGLIEDMSAVNRKQADRFRTLAEAAHFDPHDRWSASTESADALVSVSGSDSAPNWKELLEELASGQHGMLPGNLPGYLKEQFSVTESGLSYGDFLRRFAAPQERMLIDPDSIDPRWYHIGLTHYGNIPLLEEAEISEPPVPDDLVIALDTSGSCSGEVCRRFLMETLGILRDISAGAPRFRVTLMQCDTRVQRIDTLESPQQVDEFFQNFTAMGFGGTDFRPVFETIDAMRADGSLPRVRGLLYLSDGYGSFPDHPSDYPTVFLIPKDDPFGYASIPEWITQLYFDHDNFTVKEGNTP